MQCYFVFNGMYLLDVNVLVFALRSKPARIIEEIVAKNHCEDLFKLIFSDYKNS